LAAEDFAVDDFVDAVFAAGRAAFAAAACFFRRACAARSLAAALLLRGVAALAALFVLVAARAGAFAALREAVVRAVRAFVWLAFCVFAGARRALAACATEALALRDFSVFLTDDIRAHSLLVSPGRAKRSHAAKIFAAWGYGGREPPPAELEIIHYRSANLDPQATAARSQRAQRSRLALGNTIRMIGTGLIMNKTYHSAPRKSKEGRREKAEKSTFSGVEG
jgi:hypothetical protein